MLMVIAILIVVGLCLGSFINALVWRLHEQSTELAKKRPSKKYLKQLSIMQGRSMCAYCHHELAVKDLIPVVSWVLLDGKCRYCRKPIADSPIIELITALLFLFSYVFWPVMLGGVKTVIFILWLSLVIGFIALTIYDLRWLLLPNRIVYPLAVIAVVQALIIAMTGSDSISVLVNMLIAVAIGGGIFYFLFQISGGRWIGGGDVKLGWLLGLVVATPEKSLLMLFIGALAGSIVSIPLLIRGRLSRKDVIPFGPFLILAAIIVQLFGAHILTWYQTALLVPSY